MCGIAGKVYAAFERPVDRALLQKMADRMVHRGPDDEGFYTVGNVGLCMRRLQVIDLPGGRQPISTEDGTKWIVFNGEIYNYPELRQELESRGHEFRTHSDTETIIHLFEEEGERCVDKLRGMFAFAIWDTVEGSLFIARDRLGQKPLYYSECDEGLTFASELQSLVSDPAVERTIDVRAIEEYMTYLFVPHPRTVYSAVKKLPPGSYAWYRDGQLDVCRYWDLPAESASSHPDDCEELRGLLEEAVAIRTISDVPIGAFLSGGLDSSLIVAMMQKAVREPVRTFCVGFEESSFNEVAHARKTAEALTTKHEEHIVSYQIKDLVPTISRHFGEPFADSSAIPAFHLSRVTRQSVTVSLSGDGGDEVFGGYRRYQARLLADRYNRIPRALCWPIERIVQSVSEPATYYGSSLRKKAKRFLEFSAAVRDAPETSWAFFLPAPISLGYSPTSLGQRCGKTERLRALLPTCPLKVSKTV